MRSTNVPCPNPTEPIHAAPDLSVPVSCGPVPSRPVLFHDRTFSLLATPSRALLCSAGSWHSQLTFLLVILLRLVSRQQREDARLLPHRHARRGCDAGRRTQP